MFTKIINKVRGVLAKLGLISSIETLADHPKLLVNSEDYNNIEQWKAIYQGKQDWLNYRWRDNGEQEHIETYKTLNMPKVAAKKMATLVFNSKCQIDVTEANKKHDITDPKDFENDANSFVQDVLKDNYFYNNCQRYLEYMFGTGGVVVRLYVADGKVKIRFATADSFIPISEDANGVTECVIANTFVKSGKHYTFLEWHTEDDNNYIINNELYESTTGTDDDLGHKVSLKTIFPNLKDKAVYSKSLYSLPTFVYIKPNIANNLNLKSPLGVPIYAYAADTLKLLDKAYDMLWQEMEMGRRRVIVSDKLLRPRVDKNTGEFKSRVDWRDRVYQALNFQDDVDVKDITLPLRNDEIMNTIQGLLDYYSMQCGFSSGTFTFKTDGSVKTATEVISVNSETHQSKSAHETILEDAFKKIVQIILELGNNSAADYSGTTDVDVAVNFDDSIAKDRDENLKFYQTVSGNQPLMPHLEAIKRFNGITDVEAQEYLDKIKAESPTSDIDMADVLNAGAAHAD